MHPGLHRYNSPQQVSERLDQLAAAWRAPASFSDRFRALSLVTASLRCGHTYPSPYNSSAGTLDRLYPSRSLVPFRFRWLATGMTVTEDHSAEKAFPRGVVISAINEVPTSRLIADLVPMARADGGNDAKRINLMEVRGQARYETFDIHLPLILDLKDRARFTLATGRTVEAGLLSRAEREAMRDQTAASAADANPWRHEVDAEGIHRLTMASWALFNSRFQWEAWLSELMDDLSASRARGLIVDLRGNEGGQDCGDVILSRLIDRDLPTSNTQRWTRYRSAPEDVRPYLDTWDKSFLDWGDSAQPSGERPGFYRLTRYDDGADGSLIKPAGQRYRGPVVVLCDASNSSATFQFAQAVQDAGLATLIGEPTGGNRRGINGGAFFFLRLPASGLESTSL